MTEAIKLKNDNMFNMDVDQTDSEITKAMQHELKRQNEQIEMIASENFCSRAVMQAQGSVLTNKYAEGYPKKRYYGGCEHVDTVEQLAIDRLTQLFNCKYANVQPHSGSQANQAVYLALLQPGDTILGMSLDSGGHLTHGAKPNISGKWFNAVQYGVDPKTHLIDFAEVRKLALKHKPKMIIAGISAYPRQLDFAKFREIADEIGAYLFVDMAHIAGLVATNNHPSPFPYADIVTSTTHKTLRGPRGGIILTNNEEIAKKINFALFPGLQGGPLMHVIAAKAVAFKEALSPDYKNYIDQVLKNAKAFANQLKQRGFDLVTDGTDNHIIMVDLQKLNLTGKQADLSLDNAGITCNKNTVPNDPQSPFVTSGLRFGTAAGTSRGFTEEDFTNIANLVADNLLALKDNPDDNSKTEQQIKAQVKNLCSEYPLYEFYRG